MFTVERGIKKSLPTVTAIVLTMLVAASHRVQSAHVLKCQDDKISNKTINSRELNKILFDCTYH
jgi:hypothetical protein